MYQAIYSFLAQAWRVERQGEVFPCHNSNLFAGLYFILNTSSTSSRMRQPVPHLLNTPRTLHSGHLSKNSFPPVQNT